jgi:glycosyltransferase involved in cell wall biosynthesis
MVGGGRKRVLYIDMAYTFEMIKDRQLEQFWLSRECGGYFDHVWTLHPVADRPRRRPPRNEGFALSSATFSENLTALEGESTYFELLAKLPPLNVLASQVRLIAHLASFVRREGISVICATDPLLAGLIGLAVKALTGVPVVIWVVSNPDEIFASTGMASFPTLFRYRWLEKVVERFVFGQVDLTAGGNQNNLDFALRNGAVPSRSTVFPVGKNVHRAHALAPSDRPKDAFFDDHPSTRFFVCVGRLNDLKFPEDVIRAFAIARAEYPGCGLILAGDGPMRGQLESLTRELGIEPDVHFLGFVDQGRLARLFAGSFGVLSALTGGALIETALGGLPLIVYDRDWQAAFVTPAEAGIVVPHRDYRAMGAAALRLLRDPEQASRLGANARRRGLEITDLDVAFAHEQREFERVFTRSARRMRFYQWVTSRG